MRMTLVLFVALCWSLAAPGATVRGGDGGKGGACKSEAAGACGHAHCCKLRERRPDWQVRFQPPVATPIVESVPVAASPVLLSQDRFLVSTTRLRAIQLPEGTTGGERICSSGDVRQGDLRSTTDRLDLLEEQLKRLVDVVAELNGVVRKDRGM